MRGTIKYYDRNDTLKLTLNQYPYYTELGDLKDWVWDYNQQYGKINTFRRAKGDYELLIGVAGDSKTQHDILTDIFSADIIAGSPGRLEINGWSLQCYIVEAEHAFANDLDRQNKYAVLSVNSTWVRKKTTSYNGAPEGGGGGGTDLGQSADFTVIDLGAEYEINPEEFYSMGRATPFMGKKVKGKILHTYVGGKQIF